jgi:hypothetical protein
MLFRSWTLALIFFIVYMICYCERTLTNTILLGRPHTQFDNGISEVTGCFVLRMGI